MSLKRKYPFTKKGTPFRQRGDEDQQHDPSVEFKTIRTINIYFDSQKAFQAVLTFRNDQPLVGLQRQWYNTNEADWEMARGVYMNVEAWQAFIEKFDHIKASFGALLLAGPPNSKKNLRCPPAEVGSPSSASTSTHPPHIAPPAPTQI